MKSERAFAAEDAQSHNNCFNLIRLVAALQVAFGHMIVHLDLGIPTPIVNIFSFFRGVPIFFALSGFFIWQSVSRCETFKQYMQKRFWKIFPELWCGVLLELFAIIILYYEKIEWLKFGLFAIGQSTIFPFWTPNFLRGYGIGTPNGALWTMGILIQFYVIVWPLYKFLHRKSKRRYGAIFLVSLGVAAFSPLLEEVVPVLLYKLYKQTIFPYFWIFVFGILIAEYKEKVLPIAKRYWYVFTIASVIFMMTGIDIHSIYPIFRHLFQIIAIIGIGYAFPKIEIQTDISYGLYLYHMTVVNVMVVFGLTGRNIYLFMALAISCILALISTKTISAFSKRKVKPN